MCSNWKITVQFTGTSVVTILQQLLYENDNDNVLLSGKSPTRHLRLSMQISSSRMPMEYNNEMIVFHFGLQCSIQFD